MARMKRPAILSALLRTVLLCMALLAGPGGAVAQDVAAWGALAERAEETLETGRASDRAMDQLRAEIATFRERFLSAQGANKTRIDTLQAQIDGLGPLPAEGEPAEPEEIAIRRAELMEQLARITVPRREAEAAYNRADGLIREIDSTMRLRRTDEWMTRGPWPLNPAYWGPALGELNQSLVQLKNEISAGLRRTDSRPEPLENLPWMLFFLFVAVALVVRGRAWMERLTLYLYERRGGRRFGHPAFAFVVSLMQIVVPVLGMVALREAAFASGSLGLRGRIIAELLPWIGALFFGALWLGARTFPRRDSIAAPLILSAGFRRNGRLMFLGLGVCLSLNALLTRLANFDRYDPATVVVLDFPILVTAGLILWRLGMILTGYKIPRDKRDEDGFDAGYFNWLIHLIGRIVMGLGLIGPLLAVAGYHVAAKGLLFPTALSLALVTTLAVLWIVVRDGYSLLTGQSDEQAGDALVPVLIIFALSLAALPLFALIWGARTTDLSELWTRFREGFSIGEMHLSPSDFVTFLVIFAIGFGLTRLAQGLLRSAVLPRTRIDTGGRNAILAGLGYLGVFLAIVFAITTAGIDLSSLAIVAGALSVGIGFGLQNIVSNFVAGIILLIERPISEGDWIEVGGQMGFVKAISVRATRIETFDRTDVIVPNADFVSGTVTNWTRGNLTGRVIVPVGVAHGTDTRKVETVLQSIAEAHPLVVLIPPPVVLFQGFGPDSMNFEIRAILRDVNFVMTVKSDMNHEIAARFADEGFEIPVAQRVIRLRNPDALPATGPSYPTTDTNAPEEQSS